MPLHLGTLIYEFFRGFYFGVLSDILFCGDLGAISGAEIFGFFVELGFVWTAPMDSGRGKIFRSLYFWLFRGALFPVRLFSSICLPYPELRFLGFLSNSVLYGRLPWIQGAEKCFGRSIFGSFGAPWFRSGFFVDIWNFDFCLFVRNPF